MEELKTTIISYNKGQTAKQAPAIKESKTSAIKQILLNQLSNLVIQTQVTTVSSIKNTFGIKLKASVLGVALLLKNLILITLI